ncbi:MAG: hypothetical protein F6K39_29535 [Okeania sp. SIO3B3]|nr:hypothetical protein [Okeania sp. SIO3B3]
MYQLYQFPRISAILGQYFSCQLIGTSKITFLLILAKLMLIILMFASPPHPDSPAQQNVEKFLINGISCAKGCKFLI